MEKKKKVNSRLSFRRKNQIQFDPNQSCFSGNWYKKKKENIIDILFCRILRDKLMNDSTNKNREFCFLFCQSTEFSFIFHSSTVSFPSPQTPPLGFHFLLFDLDSRYISGLNQSTIYYYYYTTYSIVTIGIQFNSPVFFNSLFVFFFL